MTAVQWLTLIVFFITIAAIVVNKLDATTSWPAPNSSTSYAISCVSPSCVEFCVSSIGRSKCQSSNTTLEDWY